MDRSVDPARTAHVDLAASHGAGGWAPRLAREQRRKSRLFGRRHRFGAEADDLERRLAPERAGAVALLVERLEGRAQRRHVGCVNASRRPGQRHFVHLPDVAHLDAVAHLGGLGIEPAGAHVGARAFGQLGQARCSPCRPSSHRRAAPAPSARAGRRCRRAIDAERGEHRRGVGHDHALDAELRRERRAMRAAARRRRRGGRIRADRGRSRPSPCG